MARKTIEDASTAEIRAFAASQCGLDIHPNANKATAVQRLRAVWPEDWIEAVEAAPEAESPPARVETQPGRAPALAGKDFDRSWYLIEIPRDPKGGIDQIVPLGVNGDIQLIKRGVPSEIRAPYLEVLKNSIERQDYQVDPDDIRSEIETAYVQAYPFSILKGPYFKDAKGEEIAA